MGMVQFLLFSDKIILSIGTIEFWKFLRTRDLEVLNESGLKVNSNIKRGKKIASSSTTHFDRSMDQ